MSWKDHTSIMAETFKVDCEFEPYTKIIFENNTLINPTVARQSNIYLFLSLSQQGKTDIVIRNNFYYNVKYSTPGLFKITKASLLNANVVIENITINNLVNSDVPIAIMTIEAE